MDGWMDDDQKRKRIEGRGRGNQDGRYIGERAYMDGREEVEERSQR